MRKDAVWITWERHRRSIELARAFDVKYLELLKSDKDIPFRPLRYFWLSLKTTGIIFRTRPQVVFAQNPSIILAFLLCLLRKVARFQLVIDRHSNFKLPTLQSSNIKWKVFHFLSRFTVEQADITIVTNEFLRQLVNSWGGNGYILQDKLPDISAPQHVDLDGAENIVYVCTFSEDEPVDEILQAARKLDNRFVVYITGNYGSYGNKDAMLESLPDNVRLTGFLPDKQYEQLLASASVVVVITLMEHTLTCGAYEGVSLGKPLVLSDTEAIRNYFSKGAVYVRPCADAIANAIKIAISKKEELGLELIRLKEELRAKWTVNFQNLCKLIWK